MSDVLNGVMAGLPSVWLENYVAAFEAGRVQKHPHARFVNRFGECCIVAAMAGVARGEELVGSGAWQCFNGSELEQLSRAFESCQVTGQEVYEEVLLALAARNAVSAEVLVAA